MYSFMIILFSSGDVSYLSATSYQKIVNYLFIIRDRQWRWLYMNSCVMCCIGIYALSFGLWDIDRSRTDFFSIWWSSIWIIYRCDETVWPLTVFIFRSHNFKISPAIKLVFDQIQYWHTQHMTIRSAGESEKRREEKRKKERKNDRFQREQTRATGHLSILFGYWHVFGTWRQRLGTSFCLFSFDK